MKLDIFDFIVGAFVLVIVLMLADGVITWILQKYREGSTLRKMREEGIDVEAVTGANAGFKMGERSGAASRHFAREDETGLLTHLGWGQVPHRNPAPEESSRRYREEDA